MLDETLAGDDQVQVEKTEVAEVTETKAPVRIVTMQDGTEVNFGVRNKLLAILDEEASSVTFKLITGEIIPWVIDVNSLSDDLKKKAILYAFREKVKMSITAAKTVGEIPAIIAKQIELISGGDFNIRGSAEETGALELTDLQKAYAITASKQVAGMEHWANISDVEVIKEILSVWSTYGISKKNEIRRNPYVQLEMAQLQLAAGAGAFAL